LSDIESDAKPRKKAKVNLKQHMCKEKARASSFGCMKDIYEEAASELPGGAVLIPFAKIQRQMAQWRRELFPKNPSTCTEAVASFESLCDNCAQAARRGKIFLTISVNL